MKSLKESTISLKTSNSKFVCKLSQTQILIYQVVEGQKTLVVKLQLRLSYFKFYVKQQRYDITKSSITSKDIGPEFLYQDFAFTALVNDLIYFYYYTNENVLVSMHEKVDVHGVNVLAADCVSGDDLANYLILTNLNVYILTCRPNFITGEFQISRKSLPLPELHDESSILKWVDDNSFVLYTCSTGSYLSYFQNIDDNWVLVNRVETDIIAVLCPVFEDAILENSNLILVGYRNGRIEYLQTPSLKSTDLSQALFPGMLEAGTIDSFFNDESFKKLDKTPQHVIISSNGFLSEILTGEGKIQIKEKLHSKCKVPLDEMQDKFVNTLGLLLFLGFIKNNDLEDFRVFLSDLPASYAKPVSKKVCDIFATHVALQHSLSSSFFAPELGNVEIDILPLLYFVHLSINPDSWACRNSYLMLQLRFVKEMFLRATINPILSIETIGNFTADSENSLSNNDIKMLSMNIQYRVGSYHQLAALVLWAKDFCNLLARHLHIYFLNSNFDNESCWVFLIDMECRKVIKQVLVLALIYQYHLKEAIGINISQSEQLYLASLERTIRHKKVSIENFLQFLTQADQTLPHYQNLEREMHFDSMVNEAYKSSITSLELSYQNLERNLYEMDNGTGFASSLLFTIPRILSREIDNILLTNIPKNVKLQICRRCGQKTQVEMVIDPVIGRFEVAPSWTNSYSENCICGGDWIIQ